MKQCLLFAVFTALIGNTFAQGSWIPLVNKCPDSTGGVMMLLTDGSVIVKTDAGMDSVGNVWDRLTPDAQGSYVNGTWSRIAPMNDSRLYFSSRILRDGRVYVAGGEYGSGIRKSEVYNPLTDSWAAGPLSLQTISDANTEILPDGRILQALVAGSFRQNLIYDPVLNTYANAPQCIGSHAESSWLKLPDNSILLPDENAVTAERYIPSMNKWIADAPPPLSLYDIFGHETGAAVLLPDGRGFFLGGNSKTLFYTPSGDTSKGTWSIGPDIPNHLAAPDAAAALMPNGNVLCAFSPAPATFRSVPANDTDIFKSPTYFFEFDYRTNTFTQILAPTGDSSLNNPCYYTNMLCLPDGNILFCNQAGDELSTNPSTTPHQLYIYQPGGAPLASWRPNVSSVIKQACDSYMVTGTLFNGISEGAAYGDDWQMATNYPIVRLISGSNVYYARSYGWNSDGVQRGALADTARFTLPSSLPEGHYDLYVVANGISSQRYGFSTCAAGVETLSLPGHRALLPNPARNQITVDPTLKVDELQIVSLQGQCVRRLLRPASNIIPVTELPAGCYFVSIRAGSKIITERMTIAP